MEVYLAIINKEENKSLEQELTSIKDIYDVFKAAWENITDEHFCLVFRENGKATLRVFLPQKKNKIKN